MIIDFYNEDTDEKSSYYKASMAEVIIPRVGEMVSFNEMESFYVRDVEYEYLYTQTAEQRRLAGFSSDSPRQIHEISRVTLILGRKPPQ